MNKGWLELESDPGLFTLLVEDFGVKGVQVEEIYDLSKPIEGPVYGFIFLFKWSEERRSRRKVGPSMEESFVADEDIVNDMFFAQQLIPNSCATHALLSVLLNCPQISLGSTLTRLKHFTKGMGPESKGWAIGNVPEIARAHNSHARPEPRHLPEKQTGISSVRTAEAFHFVSYVTTNDRLFELDGLKPYPIDHGPWGEKEDWTEKFRRVISERIGNATGGENGHDIRFNLMAVVADRRQQYETKLNTLKTNRQIVLEALQQLVRFTQPHLTSLIPSAFGAEPHKSKASSTVTSASSAAAGSSAAGKDNVTTAETSDRRRHKKKKKKKKKHKALPTAQAAALTKRNTSSPVVTHPALDSHNYAKSPLEEFTEENDQDAPPESFTDDDTDEEEEEESEDEEVVASTEAMEGMNEGETNESSGGDVTSGRTSSASTEGTESATEPATEVKGSEITFSEAMRAISAVADTRKPDEFLHPDASRRVGFLDMPWRPDEAHRPLTVHTGGYGKIPSPAPSNESTDTASEIGSAFNSPVRSANRSGVSSPNPFKHHQHNVNLFTEAATKLLAAQEGHRVGMEFVRSPGATSELQTIPEGSITKQEGDTKADTNIITVCLKRSLQGGEGGGPPGKRLHMGDPDMGLQRLGSGDSGTGQFDGDPAATLQGGSVAGQGSGDGQQDQNALHAGGARPNMAHAFAPKDLLALLKNVETEIQICEQHLKDEIEKRKKYKVDDCRRTHNYDEFIRTFLRMLAEQGQLSKLVDQHPAVVTALLCVAQGN
ncbi:PREDICTED: ubiquitin carboxyl-terminal hydrolase BAP1-like [Branchiostoma belcheri]|uniref:Ubiquitin carboxyl-terminal hydrolase n=1 Tax=Branchiostoma belcheri TaxID=7741 RepID=A0A6P5ADL3_BRABE|nr:PREDICTED: ubiquitin carboxyl-terminal hydrolase BAP1-like [Branchiostoma belcheri]